MDNFDVGIDWSSPVSSTDPSGKNTEYDTKFAELEAAATATPEQQYGNTVIAGKDPDWPLVLKLASDLSQQTRDLRIQLLMTRALTRLHGLRGLLYGLASVHTTLLGFWETLHPQLELDGEQDPQLRFSALSNFGDSDGLAADLRQSVVFSCHLGVFTVRDLERLLENGSVDINSTIVTDAQLLQIVNDLQKADGEHALSLPMLIMEEINSLSHICLQRFNSEYQPDLGALLRPLKKIIRILNNDATTGYSEDLPTIDVQNTAALAQVGFEQSIKGIGGIQSRKDAVRQLELICRYFEINEPTNPAPLLIRRAMKVMEMNFMDILRDMAPEGLNQASFITGVEPSLDS